MADANEHTIASALHEETRPLMLARMQWVLGIAVVSLILSALSDFWAGSSVPYDRIMLKSYGALLHAAAAVSLRALRRSTWQLVVTASVVAWSLSCTVVSVNGWYTGDPMMPTLVLPLMVLAAGLVFPWGAAAQAALAAVASAIFLPHTPALGINLVVSVYSVFAASVYVAAAFWRQQLDRKAIELLQAAQQSVLERIAADASEDDVVAELLGSIGQQAPGSMSLLMLRDAGANRFRCAGSLGLPDAYRDAVEKASDAASAACSELAARSGRRSVIADLAKPAAEPPSNVSFALAHGLRSVWSEPIVAVDGSALGVLSVYHRDSRAPRERDLRSIETAARLAAIAIERRHARVQLERYVQALDDARQQAERQAHQLQRQAVELGEARDQALASVRVRSQFLANMSHEIRTPLNGIIGTTDILLDSELGSQQRDYVRILSQCGQHLLGVINDILDLSKIEAGKVDIERVNVDLRGLVEDVAEVLAARAQQKGIELVTSTPPALEALVKADPARLRQVLMNLVANAIKFTERGEVEIEGRVLGETPTQLTVRFSVRDTGVGIALERQAVVFDSFTQADGSTTRNFGGTGLGLSISRQLVHLMGGEIGLSSKPGVGSTFWVVVSLERAGAAAAMQAPAPSRLAGARVLVVDDTAINRTILRRSLEAWSCRVEEAASGREALAILADAPPDDGFGLAILDMQMPELDGVATARLAKATRGLRCPPLVLLSSIGTPRRGEREAAELGFAAIVTKPVRQSALRDALLGALGAPARDREHVLGGRRATSSIAPVRRRPIGLHVLLAEDNKVNQMVARRILEKLGCTSDVVDNGRDAVKAVERNRYDVVLMDIQMPVMDGFQASELIRSAHRDSTPRVPIIAMTAHAMQGDRERCLDSGMDGYIAKPVNIAALSEVLSGIEPSIPPETDSAVGAS